ncbi:MAG TPA: DNA starvation/stationary phase protection protein Dps [Drouetiella sp.]
MASTTKHAPPKLYKSRIDLPESTRKEVSDQLNETLAATLDVWSQVKQAHWNVKGKDFYQLHLLFDQIAGELYEFVDMVAERITAIGSTAHGTIKMAAAATPLTDYPLDAIDGKEHLTAVADRLAAYGKHVRAGIAKTEDLDADTADLYTEISRTTDLRLWFIEAHLQGEA